MPAKRTPTYNFARKANEIVNLMEAGSLAEARIAYLRLALTISATLTQIEEQAQGTIPLLMSGEFKPSDHETMVLYGRYHSLLRQWALFSDTIGPALGVDIPEGERIHDVVTKEI